MQNAKPDKPTQRTEAGPSRRRFSGVAMRLSEAQAARARHRVAAIEDVQEERSERAGGWTRLQTVSLDKAHLDAQRVISGSRENPAHVAFDVLRTRLVQALTDNGWSRVAITSATKDCGKTFVSSNLAISLSRQENLRTVLMDLDLRNPSVSPRLGIKAPRAMPDFLRGKSSVEESFLRCGENTLKIGPNLALGLNQTVEPFAAELLGAQSTHDAIGQMQSALQPDVVLYDLPPVLYHDDVLAFREHFDGVLVIVGGGITRANEVRDLKRRIGEDKPLLGVVLNKAEGLSISHYSY